MKPATLPEKGHSLLFQQLPSINWDPVKSCPPFETWVWGSNPIPAGNMWGRWGRWGCTLCHEIWLVESALAYNLRTRFFAEMQFWQNDKANYGASFKGWKVMSPLLKCQIFCFRSKFVFFTELLRQQIQFSKIWICHFLYIWQNILIQKIKKIHWADPEKNALQTGRQADRWTDKQDWFYRIPSAKMDVSSRFLENSRIKFSLKLFGLLWAIWKESIQENEIQST